MHSLMLCISHVHYYIDVSLVKMVSEESEKVFSHHTLSDNLSDSINQCSLLVVGAGGIGRL